MKRIVFLASLTIMICIACTNNQKKNEIVVSDSTSNQEIYFMAGKVEANDESAISSLVTARIIKINKVVGDKVNKGEVLCELDRGDIETSLISLEKNDTTAKKNLERFETLVKDGFYSQEQKEQIETQAMQTENALKQAKIQLKRGTIVSPLDGFVINVIAHEGETASIGQVLMTIANSNQKHVTAYLPESLISKVKVGKPVILRVSEIAHTTFHGKISVINPSIDLKTKCVLVKIVPVDFDQTVLAGMSVLIGTDSLGDNYK